MRISEAKTHGQKVRTFHTIWEVLIYPKKGSRKSYAMLKNCDNGKVYQKESLDDMICEPLT